MCLALNTEPPTLTASSSFFFSFSPVCRFDKDDSQQNKKLDDMDLDDILNRAEDHETMTSGEGASLGGEGFLNSFAAVSDIKNDMAWEDIIPLQDRLKFEKEEEERKMAELTEATRERKRATNPVSYEGMDVDVPPAAPSKKPKAPAPPRKTAGQRALMFPTPLYVTSTALLF